MKLRLVELYRFQLAFSAPVVTAEEVHRVRPVALVRVVTDEVEGWGECAALAGGTAVDPAFATVIDALEGSGVGQLLAAASARGGDLPPAAGVAALFGSSPVAHFVAATLEMAVLDAELRAGGAPGPLWRRLGVEEHVAEGGVPVGRLVGIPPDRDVGWLLQRVGELVRSGTTARVRVKIEPGWDVEPLRLVREAFPGLALQADANGSYEIGSKGPNDAGRLAQLDVLGLSCIEQPLPPGDLAALAHLAARLETPVALDESLTSLRRLEDALRCGACEVACVKPARLGGLLRARSAARACEESGAGAFVGGFFESGPARSANVALAGLPAFGLAGDLSDPEEYLDCEASFGHGPGTGGALVRPYDGPGVAPPPRPPGPPVRAWRIGAGE